LITLQEKIDTDTVEGVESVGEEDYIQLVHTIKTEQEVGVCVGVFCGSDLFTGVCCTVHCI
jgi:hypothetical protein